MKKEDLLFIRKTLQYGLDHGKFNNKGLCKFHEDAFNAMNLIDKELKKY